MERSKPSEVEGSHTYLVQCSELRKDEFIMIDKRPSTIVDTFRYGSRHYSRMRIHATDIFTGERYVSTFNSRSNVEVPRVSHEDYQLIDVEDGYLTLMADSGLTRQDIRVPRGLLGARLKAEFNTGKELFCTVLQFHDEECVVGIKEKSDLDK